MLTESPIFQILALACLAPAFLAAVRQPAGDGAPAGLLAVAAAGPAIWVTAVLTSGAGWRTDFTFTIWVSVAATLAFLLLSAIAWPAARRCAVLALPYLAALLLCAVLFGRAPHSLAAPPDGWILVHIVVAVATYALITLAAVAGFAVFLKERALKARRPDGLAARLPAVTAGEDLQGRLLILGEAVLGVGLITGIAIHVQRGETLLSPDHKTLLTLAAFAIIGLLLILRRRGGIRGRRAAHLVLIAYLLVTLAYPGVKFVSDVLMA